MPHRVQNAGQQGGQRDEKDIGKGDLAKDDRQSKAFVPDKARGHGKDQKRHCEMADHRKHGQKARHAPIGIAGEGFGVFMAFQFLGEHRHEGHVQRPFGEEAAEHVGQGLGDEKRLGHGARAQVVGDHHVADKAHGAGQQGPKTHGQKAADQADRFHRLFAPARLEGRLGTQCGNPRCLCAQAVRDASPAVPPSSPIMV